MKVKRNFVWTAAAIAVIAAGTPLARGAIISGPITGWNVHNGTTTVGGPPPAPTFAPGDNITVMAPFDNIRLRQDGDFLEVEFTLTMSNRTANTGVNALNTQLRMGLFEGPAGPIVAGDVPNLGLIIEYTNQAAGGLIREQFDPAQPAPFVSPNNLGNGTADSDSISGANPPPVTFKMRLTRNGGEIDLLGSIAGGNHAATYILNGHSSATFPMNGQFDFNRVGLFLGNNVDATVATIIDARFTTNVPEPAVLTLAASALLGGLSIGRRRRRVA
jgi:hypothetical protein